MPVRAVIFDFDGTIALGRGPLTAYARCIGTVAGEANSSATLASTNGSADAGNHPNTHGATVGTPANTASPSSPATPANPVLTACLTIIDEFEAGRTQFSDAYDAVRSVALDHGVSEQQLSTAYLRSRELLATAEAPISPPEGLADFLRELSERATCVVATNAPAIGLDRALASLGIAPWVDEVHVGLGKPAGLQPILAKHVALGATLSVGDRWDNDLAPAVRVGADTALVGGGPAPSTPTMCGGTLTDIYDDILAWARTAEPHPQPSGRTPATGSADAPPPPRRP